MQVKDIDFNELRRDLSHRLGDDWVLGVKMMSILTKVLSIEPRTDYLDLMEEIMGIMVELKIVEFKMIERYHTPYLHYRLAK